MFEWKIVTIVNHGLAHRLNELAVKAGANGGTILHGRGYARSPLLRTIGLGGIEKDILITLTSEDELERITTAIKTAHIYPRHNAGISFCISIGGSKMPLDTEHELITVIVNRGYADDIMDAARKAGANGGTILHARGTGKPDDEKFFGITIVPEKEEVLILAEMKTSAAIQEAIQSLSCLTTPGIGIMYTSPVSRFIQLGK
ncbi:MAG TPA: transcriptional regulator [Treponemataceae bacterium]|nr:transcriptional regulator [Treponemataceae bacterium]